MLAAFLLRNLRFNLPACLGLTAVMQVAFLGAGGCVVILFDSFGGRTARDI